jgi:hypothetical protein
MSVAQSCSRNDVGRCSDPPEKRISGRASMSYRCRIRPIYMLNAATFFLAALAAIEVEVVPIAEL